MAYAYTPVALSEALDQVLGERRTREFSATVLIGGKLRALYNEADQPSLSRLNELLRELERVADAWEPPRLSGRYDGVGKSPVSSPAD